MTAMLIAAGAASPGGWQPGALAVIIVGAIGAVATVVGTVLTVRGARSTARLNAKAQESTTQLTTQTTAQTAALESVDRRIAEAFDAKDAIIRDRTEEIGRLVGRIEAAEITSEQRQARYDRRFSDLSERLETVAASEAELRIWAAEISVWAARAVAEISRLRGAIDSPPPLPPQRRIPKPRDPSD